MSICSTKAIAAFAFLVLALPAPAEAAAWTPARIDRAERDAAASHDLQLELPGIETPPQAPDGGEADARPLDLSKLNWLAALLGKVGTLLFWGLIAGVVLLVVVLAVREFPHVADWLARRRARNAGAAWTVHAAPSREAAASLLEDADRLAAAGRHAEAVRLLLHRTLEDIGRRTNRSLPPALTSREILAGTALAPAGHDAFDDIVGAVELSYFGGRAFGAADYARCRDSYERFALSGAAA